MLRLVLMGVGAMNSPRYRPAGLLLTWPGHRVMLDGGGSIHVEATRAAVLIDVDSGTPETGSPERTGLAINLAAANAIASIIGADELHPDYIIPSVFDRRVGDAVAAQVEEAAYISGVARRQRATADSAF